MLDHEAAMLAFVKLAGVAQTRGQLPQRDKFLLLTGAAACRGNWTVVAERCRQLVLTHNPLHLLKRYPSFAAAMEDEEFQTYFKQLSRFCSYERAEHYLTQLQISPGFPTTSGSLSAGDYALLLLGKSDWSTTGQGPEPHEPDFYDEQDGA